MVDIFQPDVKWVGGITASVRICHITEAVGLSVITHGGRSEGDCLDWFTIFFSSSDLNNSALLLKHHTYLAIHVPVGVPGRETPNRKILFTLTMHILIEHWRKEYNQVRPYNSLGYRPSAPETISAETQQMRI